MDTPLFISKDDRLSAQDLANVCPDINDTHTRVNPVDRTANKRATLVHLGHHRRAVLVSHRNNTPSPQHRGAMNACILNHKPVTLVHLTLTRTANNNNPAFISRVLRHGWVYTNHDGQTRRQLSHARRVNEIVLPQGSLNVV